MQEASQEALSAQTLRHRYEELQKQAAKDALSGLLNRATAEQYITQRLEKMGPEERCAMFIVDLDNFKRVNDTLGHQAGTRPSAARGRSSPASSGPATLWVGWGEMSLSSS